MIAWLYTRCPESTFIFVRARHLTHSPITRNVSRETNKQEQTSSLTWSRKVDPYCIFHRHLSPASRTSVLRRYCFLNACLTEYVTTLCCHFFNQWTHANGTIKYRLWRRRRWWWGHTSCLPWKTLTSSTLIIARTETIKPTRTKINEQ